VLRQLAKLAWWLAILSAGAFVVLVLRHLYVVGGPTAIAHGASFDTMRFSGGADHAVAGAAAFLLFAAWRHARRFFAKRAALDA